MPIKKAIILIALSSLQYFSFSQAQLTINLIANSGTKTSKVIDISILNKNDTILGFSFDKFSKPGNNTNPNIFQYNYTLDPGFHTVYISFESTIKQLLTDTVRVDGSISRIEMFIYIESSDSLDYINGIKTLKYVINSDYLRFVAQKKLKIGSKAVFKILNLSDRPIYSYPNNAFFFGTLYKKMGESSWIQYFPKSIDMKYCNTNSPAKVLEKGAVAISWTPTVKNCSEFILREKGEYYFELLYSTSPLPGFSLQGLTKIEQVNVYRQILSFKI